MEQQSTGINEMWVLKNSSQLLQKMNSFYYPKIHVTSTQTSELSTLSVYMYIHPSSEAEGQDAHVGKSNISLWEWLLQVQIPCGQ